MSLHRLYGLYALSESITSDSLEHADAIRVRDWSWAERFEPEIGAAADRDRVPEILGDDFSIFMLLNRFITANDTAAMVFDGERWHPVNPSIEIRPRGDFVILKNKHSGEVAYARKNGGNVSLIDMLWQIDGME